MKKCFGIIVNDLDDKVSLMDFIFNAVLYGHTIDEVILIYSGKLDAHYVENIKRYTELKAIHVADLKPLGDELLNYGVDENDINVFLEMRTFHDKGVVTYSKKRNLVLLRAMLDQMDLIYFIDSDVHPVVLYDESNSKEIDFVGEHLKHLKRDNIAATTSDYTGYYILPPMEFQHMDAFLKGIQKSSAYPFLKNGRINQGLKFGAMEENRQPNFTDKMLGGNLVMQTKYLFRMPPFFSYHFTIDGQTYLTRGEDTTMGLFFNKSKLNIIDIDLKIMHDTFGTFPKFPDLKNDPGIKNRLYYASMGWIGRNPFFNYIKGEDYIEIATYQREAMVIGSQALAKYTQDSRFLIMPRAIDQSLLSLKPMIAKYESTLKAWKNIVEKIGGIK